MKYHNKPTDSWKLYFMKYHNKPTNSWKLYFMKNHNKPTDSWKLYFMKYHNKPFDTWKLHQRCSKLQFNLSTLPTCSNGWNWGVAHCAKVWGPCYLSPLSDWDSLVPLELACKRRYITCGAWHHMKPIPDEMSIKQILFETFIRLNITSNLYEIWHILKSYTI